jgi:glucose/mannose-6-phosphate isomerase
VNDQLLPGQRQMFAWIDGLPAQLEQSASFAGLERLAPLAKRPARVLCCGMGGSAMAASLLADGWPGLALPVDVWRDEGLPVWADADTLVIASSHSGDTAETLAAVTEARRRGCPLVAVTSGGQLAALAAGQDGGAPFPAVLLPGGQPPRTALGASLGALLHVCGRLGLLPDQTVAIAAACALARRGDLMPRLGVGDAPVAAPAVLAGALADRFTVIYTSGPETHGAGRRLLAQLNENAKAAGHVACFPELNHNEIVGWNLAADRRELFALVVLRGPGEAAARARRVDATVDLLADQFACVHQLVARGPDHLSRVLGLILCGDLISAHLAVHTGVDPVPISRIDALKARLGGV